MSGMTAMYFKLILLAVVFLLALSPSLGASVENDALINVTASSNSSDSGPVFLNYAKEQQNHKISESVIPVMQKNNNIKTTNKKQKKDTDAPHQAVIVSQKDKIIKQLRFQLQSKPITINTVSENQKELENKIQHIQEKLAVATAEKQRLINKERSAAAEIKKITMELNEMNRKIQLQVEKTISVEIAKKNLELQLKEVFIEKEAQIKENSVRETKNKDTASKLVASEASRMEIKRKLDASEASQKSLVTKLTTYAAEKEHLIKKQANMIAENEALMAKLDSFTLSKQKSILQEHTAHQELNKNKALLQASADEINQLKSMLVDADAKAGKKSTSADLTKEPQQLAYSIGVSMGEDVLKLLSTRSSQGVKVSKDTVLKGIQDTFSGTIALDEKVRNKALFNVSKKVFQNLNKIEQQMISEGKKYQQEFVKQERVVFKDGVYSRIDYMGEGKLLDNDTVTVTVKETLIDGTVINDMEAEGTVWSQPLKSYPPVFLGPIKRLGNHGSITIVIPPELAYGSEGWAPKIPPGATMVYSVRIVDTTAAEQQAKNSDPYAFR